MKNISHIKEKVVAILVFAMIICAMMFIGIPCFIKSFTGISCPGCGMTRAFVSLFRLDVGGAFSYHKMFWAVPVLGLYFIYDGKLFHNKWIDCTVLALIGAGFLANWIINLAL